MWARIPQLSADFSPEQEGVLKSGAKMLKRVMCEKERLAGAVQNLQEALQQELSRRQVLCIAHPSTELLVSCAAKRRVVRGDREPCRHLGPQYLWSNIMMLLKYSLGSGPARVQGGPGAAIAAGAPTGNRGEGAPDAGYVGREAVAAAGDESPERDALCG